MKSKFQTLALTGTAILAMSLGATGAQAQQANNTKQATAKATVVTALVLTKASDLNFGTVVPGAAASTVAVSNAGAVTCGAGLVCLSTQAVAARFSVTGTANSTVSVTYPTNVTLTGPGGTSMTAKLDALPAPGTLLLGVGATAFAFGGTLNVGINQAEGAYSTADFDVTVNYQ